MNDALNALLKYFVIDQDKVDYMNSKPIDWETSHWWSGE